MSTKNQMLELRKTSILTKVIGGMIAVSTLAIIAVNDAPMSIGQTTELRSKPDNRDSPFKSTKPKADNYLKLGAQKFYQQDYRGALADYNRAIQLDSNFVEAYNYRGNLKQNKLKDYQGALADFNRAIQLAPSYALLHKNRGVLKFQKLQDYQGALADLDRAIQLAPNYAEAYGQRGGLKHEVLDDPLGGIADTQKAARLFKQQGDTNNYNVAIGLLKKWK